MDFSSFLNSKLKEQNINLKKLSEASGITLKHLENLIAGNFSDLPASPYLHGYLTKLGEVLDFDGEKWWHILKSDPELFSSGSFDKLPQNRFAKKTQTKKIWIGLAILIVLFYFGLRLPKIIGQPELTILFPSEEATNFNTEEIILSGSLKNGDKILVNKDEVPIDENGFWQKNITLEPGLNTIEITGKKFLGREIKILRQIIYEPIENSTEENLPGTGTSTTPTSTEE